MQRDRKKIQQPLRRTENNRECEWRQERKGRGKWRKERQEKREMRTDGQVTDKITRMTEQRREQQRM